MYPRIRARRAGQLEFCPENSCQRLFQLSLYGMGIILLLKAGVIGSTIG